MKIVDADNSSVELPHGSQGRICIRGPPCFPGYLNHDNDSTFLENGFFDTGDLGYLDEDGYLFISGRSKEVINRGGEIICPADVEEAVSHHTSVSSCMAFSASHDVLQEVVGIAVVLCDDESTFTLLELQRFLRNKLSQSKWPQCLIIMDDLPKSHTNKILRVRFGCRLGLPVFTDATPANKRTFRASCPDPGTPLDVAIVSELQESRAVEEYGDGFNGSSGDGTGLKAKGYAGPSTALNGVRFIAGFFVVFGHVGTYPSTVMLKLQAYSLAMQIFFFLASFQMSCKIKNEVLSTWSLFVGSKIGSLHALFAVTQLIAVVPYLLFQCGANGFKEVFENATCNANHGLAMPLSLWALNTLTGLVGSFTFDQVNSTNWFMGVLYTYIIVFPWLHSRLQRFFTSPDGMFVSFLVAGVLAIAVPGLIFLFFGFFELNYTIVTWIPSLLAASIAGTFFAYLQGDEIASKPAKTAIARKLVVWAQNPRNWGTATDTMSLVMIVLVVAAALSPRCLYVDEETFEDMRPESDLPTDVILSFDQTPMYWVCNVSYDEWYDHVRETCGSGGRWVTQVTKFFRFGRFGSPIVWLWLFGMSFGQGYTAKLMKNEVLQRLSPLAYPLYLLHLPVVQLYWLATRGLEPQEWWDCPGNVAVPVHWYELLGITFMCLLLGHLLDRFLMPHLIPKSIQLGVCICRAVSRLIWCESNTEELSTLTVESSFDQVSNMIRAGSGIEVSPETLLADTGLDSLGLTALLGNIRASVPSAKRKLTLQRLAQFETVGELSSFLDATGDDTEDKEGDGQKTQRADFLSTESLTSGSQTA